MNDFLGRGIRVNDNVVWPVQSGHRISMRYGQVVTIHPTSITVRPYHNSDDALVSIRRVDNVVVLV